MLSAEAEDGLEQQVELLLPQEVTGVGDGRTAPPLRARDVLLEDLLEGARDVLVRGESGEERLSKAVGTTQARLGIEAGESVVSSATRCGNCRTPGPHGES
ncbi:hypothetical protein OHT76_22910 [Streptomyces sp. NBC_00287]|uniref:hypothetical protein n=1 Tax=Streptomyces sp. NBC_00287 TaxID=2975702 RepID=UPI002E28E67A|nr:hypothetical protein [Streptomyces sp. NBC_00287]